MQNSKIKELFKEHRDLILVTTFFIVGSLLLIWLANTENNARQAVDKENAKVGRNGCIAITKLINNGNISKGISVKLDDLTYGRIGCANYLKYLSVTEENIPNMANEIQQTEQTLQHIDKALAKSDEYKKNSLQ